jgi:hypothetical protein
VIKESLLITIVILVLAFGVSACDDSGIDSQDSQTSHGLSGLVVDTLGRPLDSVEIYCLFDLYYLPPSQAFWKPLTRISGIDTFGFRMYQNFPNPFSNSTFMRFSLPRAAVASLTIRDQGGVIRYSREDSLLEGLYQYYLFNLVDSLQLANGPYSCILAATADDKTSYSASVSIFVVSDTGEPAAITGTPGYYSFDYRKAFIGDTMYSTNDGFSLYPVPLTDEVNLLYKRRGFVPSLHRVKLYPNLNLRFDVVLQQGE